MLSLAAIAIPSARQCMMAVAPLAAIWVLRWLHRHGDEIIQRLFPHWEWERKLGWLNLRAHRRADAFLRALRYIVQALLAVALYGIVWSAAGLSSLWNDPEGIAGNWRVISVLLVSLGLWAVYFGCELIPKLRREHEGEQLEEFRADEEISIPEGPSSRLGQGPLLSKTASLRSRSRRN